MEHIILLDADVQWDNYAAESIAFIVRSKFRMHCFEKPGQERDSGEYLL
jgi:hypothetical protein